MNLRISAHRFILIGSKGWLNNSGIAAHLKTEGRLTYTGQVVQSAPDYSLTPYCKEKPILGHGNADKIDLYQEKAKRADVDLPYFQLVQLYSSDEITWNIYYYDKEDQNGMKEKLRSIGVMEERICMKDAKEFWD